MKLFKYEKRCENGYVEENWMITRDDGYTTYILSSEELESLVTIYNDINGHKCCGKCSNK